MSINTTIVPHYIASSEELNRASQIVTGSSTIAKLYTQGYQFFDYVRNFGSNKEKLSQLSVKDRKIERLQNKLKDLAAQHLETVEKLNLKKIKKTALKVSLGQNIQTLQQTKQELQQAKNLEQTQKVQIIDLENCLSNTILELDNTQNANKSKENELLDLKISFDKMRNELDTIKKDKENKLLSLEMSFNEDLKKEIDFKDKRIQELEDNLYVMQQQQNQFTACFSQVSRLTNTMNETVNRVTSPSNSAPSSPLLSSSSSSITLIL